VHGFFAVQVARDAPAPLTVAPTASDPLGIGAINANTPLVMRPHGYRGADVIVETLCDRRPGTQTEVPLSISLPDYSEQRRSLRIEVCRQLGGVIHLAPLQ